MGSEMCIRDSFRLERMGRLFQPFNQILYGLVFGKAQNRCFLPRLVLDKRGQRRHGAVAIGQYFTAHNGIDGGGFAGFHGAHHGQHHFEFFGFVPVFGQNLEFLRNVFRREKFRSFIYWLIG